MNYERELLKVGEVAAIVGVCNSTIWANAKAGKFPQPIKIGGITRWKRSEINALSGQTPPKEKKKPAGERMPPSVPFGPDTHQLYRHFDKDGNLLYVGISLSAVTRLCGHKKDSAWFWKIARVKVKAYASKQIALEAERIAIQRERPLHNVKHMLELVIPCNIAEAA